MSLFLGKIHFWLFNKILWFEGLENEIIDVAKSEGLDILNLQKEIEDKYGTKLPNKPLDEIIDTSNIHGWLQERIYSSEGRIAAWTTVIIDNKREAKTKLEEIYINQGIIAAKEVKEEGIRLDSAENIFNKVNDYILDGMPCDRVNEIINSNENCIEWTRRICVHKEIWDKESGDVEYFYFLRSLWIKAFVNEINNEFDYLEENNGVKSIRRK
ncbi:conserved hypothetical protein [Clostridium botulinum B str. Eklund 17B (NRP)]|uniref:Uncharacterized protein n=1 Tax=Clostridium botulinum (strain Eklund 17B / Type B) TaxID=935198 RepID=B2TM30_CLOBB|nr:MULTISPECIES: hypothetical protein [unclassified Clostridium]ACD23720.1 conserved hypothetical protein [Clostridium botulinum B str. Eklund 17B (NRP)]MBY6977089.1 hypothetical protein [Clostridium botulinum]MBY6999247.1 hypothetical protein [Clostridium botulinum]MCR1272672.1 hypothetical protein [Clostridium botulinum]NFD69959.1 hypothetical protein [Clostridium botulinum]